MAIKITVCAGATHVRVVPGSDKKVSTKCFALPAKPLSKAEKKARKDRKSSKARASKELREFRELYMVSPKTHDGRGARL